LVYDVYFGAADAPPFAAQINGEPVLEVGELEPLRTYRWRVEVTDRQGDRVVGPLWRFTTGPEEETLSLPPPPPPFMERLRRHPAVPLGLIALFVGVSVFVYVVWRRRGQAAFPPNGPPEWYSEDDDT
jgi:hypothetical protein